MKVLIEIQYLPPIEYFCSLLPAEEIIIEKFENYQKQSYRNRCYINAANGIIKLVIPVTDKHGSTAIRDVKIDYSSNWQNVHWRTIKSAYRNAVYFEHYAQEIHDALFKRFDFLYDLNFSLLSFCLHTLGQSSRLTESTRYEKVPANGITDLRSRISPKKPYSSRTYYQPVPYVQVFGNKFASNLSFLDLLFCEGPNSIQLVKSSTQGYLNK